MPVLDPTHLFSESHSDKAPNAVMHGENLGTSEPNEPVYAVPFENKKGSEATTHIYTKPKGPPTSPPKYTLPFEHLTNSKAPDGHANPTRQKKSPHVYTKLSTLGSFGIGSGRRFGRGSGRGSGRSSGIYDKLKQGRRKTEWQSNNPQNNELNTYVDNTLKGLQILGSLSTQKTFVIYIISFTFNDKPYDICNISLYHGEKRTDILRYILYSCKNSIKNTVKQKLQDNEFFVYKNKEAKYILCTNQMCYDDKQTNPFFLKPFICRSNDENPCEIKYCILPQEININGTNTITKLNTPVFFIVCDNVLLKASTT